MSVAETISYGNGSKMCYVEDTKIDIPITEILLTITTAIVAYYVLDKIKYFRTLPPGPWGLPLVGYLPWIVRSRAPHSSYLNLAAKYGDLVSLTLGKNLVVCLGSAKLIRELFSRSDSTGRPHTPLNNLLQGRGIILSEGDLWKQQRQFLYQKFRALGVRFWENQPFEQHILMEIEELLTKLISLDGEPVNPVEVLGRHIHNVICQLMMSFRFKEGDEEFIQFNRRVAEGMRLFGAVHIGEHIPYYLRLPGKTVVIEEIARNLRDISQFHEQHVASRRQQRSKHRETSNHPADLLDCFLDAIDKDNEALSKIFPGAKDELDVVNQMVQVMNDLFSAGMETSRTTLAWSLVMMLREPDVATKVRGELAAVVEPGELVTLDHRQNLPFTEAVLYETLRRVSVVPLGTTHVNTSTWKVDNYTIPAGTNIIPLINRIHMDPIAFPEPEKFIPERFLKDNKLVNLENFIPFGVGRRMCLGEQLARMELFLFFSNLMNSFSFELAEPQEVPGLEGTLGITHAPLPFKLRFNYLKLVDLDMKPNGTKKTTLRQGA